MRRVKIYYSIAIMALVILPLILFISLPAFAAEGGSTYKTFFVLDPRKAIWFLAQMHLYFGAFVLGVPIFAVIIEYVGYRSGDERFDKLAYEFTSLLSVAYATTAAIGGLLAFALYGLYPTFMGYMTNVFSSAMWIYALLFFGETFTLYLYYYGWSRFKGKKEFPVAIKTAATIIGAVIILCGIGTILGFGNTLKGDVRAFIGAVIITTGLAFLLIKNSKGLHLSFGVLLNVFGTLIMLAANSWASYMMSPVGVDAKGVFIGTTWQAVINPLWIPLGIHRMLGNLAFGGFVAGAYAAVKFIGSKTDEERAHYDWMGYISNFVGIAGLLPLPFAGYYLGR